MQSDMFEYDSPHPSSMNSVFRTHSSMQTSMLTLSAQSSDVSQMSSQRWVSLRHPSVAMEPTKTPRSKPSPFITRPNLAHKQRSWEEAQSRWSVGPQLRWSVGPPAPPTGGAGG